MGIVPYSGTDLAIFYTLRARWIAANPDAEVWEQTDAGHSNIISFIVFFSLSMFYFLALLIPKFFWTILGHKGSSRPPAGFCSRCLSRSGWAPLILTAYLADVGRICILVLSRYTRQMKTQNRVFSQIRNPELAYTGALVSPVQPPGRCILYIECSMQRLSCSSGSVLFKGWRNSGNSNSSTAEVIGGTSFLGPSMYIVFLCMQTKTKTTQKTNKTKT